MNTDNHRGWDGNTLKWIALLSMLIDHIGVIYLSYGSHALLSVYSLSRYIGRLSFPLFCFLLVEGFYHTGNLCKYVQRMLGFAFLAEIPYDLAIYGKLVKLDGQNVLFTFVIGLLVMWMLTKVELWSIPMYGIVLFGCAAAYLLRVDYSWYGILLIVVFYVFHDQKTKRNLAAAVLLFWQPASLVALLCIQWYNGERGRVNRTVFYWFYPVHLLILYALQYILMPARMGF